MPNLNKVFLIGHAGKNPELRHITSGKAVCTFSIATTERWSRGGEKQEKTTWHNIVAWDKLGEWAGGPTGIHKGDLVIVEGKIDNRSYEDKDKNRRYVSEVIAQSIQVQSKDRAPSGVVNEPDGLVGGEGNAHPSDEDLPF
jgi:single-strand DNA-binding protein